jgi:phenylalanyl-tRNA synthetase beta chain
VCDESLNNAEIVDCIKSTGCVILESIDLFDLYRDSKTLGDGKKSFAYSLTYRSSEKTLTDSEVNKAHEEIRTILASKLSIVLR